MCNSRPVPDITTPISLTFLAAGVILLGAASADGVSAKRRDLLSLVGNVAAVVGAIGALVAEFRRGTPWPELLAGLGLGVGCLLVLMLIIRFRQVLAFIRLRIHRPRPRQRQRASAKGAAEAVEPTKVDVSRPLPSAAGLAHPSTEWWSRNALALIALSPVVVAALRVIFFSRGDPALLATLGRSLDVPGVLLAGVVPLLGLAVSYTLFIVIANRHLTPPAGAWLRDLPPLPTTLLMVGVGVATLTTPATDALFLLLLPLVGVGYRVLANRADRRRGRYIPADVPGVIAAFVLVVLQSAGPWVPEEAVTFTDGSTTTAYVLPGGDGWTTLVDVDDREVTRVRDERIDAREVCGSPRSRTLLHVIYGTSAQPECPDRRDASKVEG